jgi:RHS repeat-associated protein
VYDADGQRMVRRHVDGATAYIEGHELNANNSGASLKAVRTYTLEGRPVATRTPQGVQFLLADEQGSVELTVPSGSSTPSHIRAYEPYGAKRTSAEPATDRGWIGQIEDDRTGLNYLNARYYDPVMARFLAPDPLYDQARPQSVNPYQYGLNNPTTNGDPTGLEPRPWHDPSFDSRGFDYEQAIGCDGYGTQCANTVAPYSAGSESLNLIASEIQQNSEATVFAGIAQMFDPCDSLTCQVGGVRPSPEIYASSLVTLLTRFCTGCDWDHKPDIKVFSSGLEWVQIDASHAIRFDVFSNIHYGYVLSNAGMPESEAQTYANLGEELDWLPQQLRDVVGQNDEADRVAVHLGYELQSQVVSRDVSAEDLRGLLVESFNGLEAVGAACNVTRCR